MATRGHPTSGHEAYNVYSPGNKFCVLDGHGILFPQSAFAANIFQSSSANEINFRTIESHEQGPAPVLDGVRDRGLARQFEAADEPWQSSKYAATGSLWTRDLIAAPSASHSASTSSLHDDLNQCTGEISARPSNWNATASNGNTRDCALFERPTRAYRRPNRPRYPCLQCDATFSELRSLRRHYASRHHGTNSILCPHAACPFARIGFNRRDTLERHVRRRH